VNSVLLARIRHAGIPMIDIRLGDCVGRTSEIADSSIDLILTSPPYDSLRRYGSGSAFDFEGLAAQCKRVLKPGGVLVWVVGDETKDGSESGSSFRQALHFQSIGLKRRDTMIWLKANPMHCGDPSHYVGAFEFMFVFTLGRPRTANILREPCKQVGHINRFRRHRMHGADTTPLTGASNPCNETKARSNVWTYPTSDRIATGHSAVFPLQLAIDHILSWTNPGDLVLDPFVGSGTTLLACLQADRHGIGIDKDPAYCEIARRRIAAELDKCPLLTGTDRS
jgi:DNA modification methylase